MSVQSVSIHVPSTAAGTTDEWYKAWPFKGEWRVTTVMWTPATAVAVAAANIATLTLTKNDGAAGSDSSAIASKSNNSSGGTADVLKTTQSLTVTQRGTISQGEQFKLAKTEAASGAITEGELTIVCEKMN
jgi:hypothetical protein